MQRKKWTKENEFEFGRLVLIKEDFFAPAQGQIGRIKKLIKGKDNLMSSVVFYFQEQKQYWNEQEKNTSTTRTKTFAR